MKILVLSHMYPSTANEVAGIFVHDQVKALTTKGIEVRVVSPVPWSPFPLNRISRKWRDYSLIPYRSDWNGVQVYYPKYVAYPRALFFEKSGYRMYRGIRDTVENLYHEFSFDIIHAHVALPDGYAASLIANKLPKPIILTIHGQDLQQTVNRNKKCKEAVLYSMSCASKIILVSRKLKHLAYKHFGSTFMDKLEVIPNGINPQETLNLNELKNRKNDLIILSVSNLIKIKGLEYNIFAVNKLRKKYPDIKYWIIGSGPEEKRLKNLVLSLGLEQQVLFLGRQSHDEVFKYMLKCSVFSLPSWNEAFGVVYLEAMGCGKPVIGCMGQGIEDFVEHGKTGFLVKPQDIDSLVEALDYLFSNPFEARKIGKRAKEVVLEQYTWEKNTERTIALYRKVLNER